MMKKLLLLIILALPFGILYTQLPKTRSAIRNEYCPSIETFKKQLRTALNLFPPPGSPIQKPIISQVYPKPVYDKKNQNFNVEFLSYEILRDFTKEPSFDLNEPSKILKSLSLCGDNNKLTAAELGERDPNFEKLFKDALEVKHIFINRLVEVDDKTIFEVILYNLQLSRLQGGFSFVFNNPPASKENQIRSADPVQDELPPPSSSVYKTALTKKNFIDNLSGQLEEVLSKEFGTVITLK